MSYLTISFPRGKIVKPRCECCHETKPERNDKRVCDTCDGGASGVSGQGCKKMPWDNYKRCPSCPLMIKRKKNNARVQATAAWNRREKKERLARGR